MPATLGFDNIRLRSGVRLQCAQQGKPGAPALLMLHGYTDSWFSFSRILPLLPPGLRVIVPDQRGHGDSERPAAGYGLDDLASDAIHLLDELDIGAATVVGHSMGSLIAQRVAVLAPERVQRLVLIGSATTVRNNAVLELARAVDTLPDPVPPNFVREFQMSAVYRPVPPEFLDRVVAESLKVPARLWKLLLTCMLQAEWKSASLASIRCPTLVLWGDQDAFFPRAQQDELLRLIPRARLTVSPGVGHSPHWEVPGDFVRDLLAFHA